MSHRRPIQALSSTLIAAGFIPLCVTRSIVLTWQAMPVPLIGKTVARCRVCQAASAPLVDSNGDIYMGTKDNDDSKLYKINGTCPALLVIWETDTNADVYTTGVLLDSGLVVIGTEPDETAGILKAYSTTELEATMEDYFNLYADMTWGSLRVHKGRLIGVANVPTTILGAFMFSIDLAGAGYEHDAENATFRGNNASTGR